MNSIEHFRETSKVHGPVVGAMATLPDLFQLGKYIPVEAVQRYCLNMHNTEESVYKMFGESTKLGLAWEMHRNQDLLTHQHDYPYVYKQWDKGIPQDRVLMFSGGLDSFAAWRLLNQPPAVYFDIGHKAAQNELQRVEMIEEDFDGDFVIEDRLKLTDIEMDSGYIPYRNLLFIALASYLSPDVVIGQIAEYAPDKNQRFYHHAEKLLNEISSGSFWQMDNGEVKVHAPFRHLTKTQLVREYAKRFDPQELVKYTVSCYSGKDVACGECNACIQRYVAMENNGIHESYLTTPEPAKLAQKWSLKDFKASNIPMYVKRYFEMKEFL